MHIIALVTQKGGTGKSTLAIGLAIAAMQNGHKVRLLETDPQGTVSNWRARRTEAEPAVETVSDASEIGERLEAFARDGVTLTIVDTAGGNSAATAAAIAAADLCLIPTRPSAADIEAAAPTLRTVRDNDKPFAFVLNQTPVRSYRLATAAAALSDTAIELNVMGVLALPYIVLRNDQQDALGAGLSVTEYASAGKSAEEIRGLWSWVACKLSPPAYVAAEPAYIEEGLRAAG